MGFWWVAGACELVRLLRTPAAGDVGADAEPA
jgi:hypothetical protein